MTRFNQLCKNLFKFTADQLRALKKVSADDGLNPGIVAKVVFHEGPQIILKLPCAWLLRDQFLRIARGRELNHGLGVNPRVLWRHSGYIE